MTIIKFFYSLRRSHLRAPFRHAELHSSIPLLAIAANKKKNKNKNTNKNKNKKTNTNKKMNKNTRRMAQLILISYHFI